MDNNENKEYDDISQLTENVRVIKQMVKYQAENIQNIKNEQNEMKKLLYNIATGKQPDISPISDDEPVLYDVRKEEAIKQPAAKTDSEEYKQNDEALPTEQYQYRDKFTIDDEKFTHESGQNTYAADYEPYDSSQLEFRIGSVWLNRIAIILIVLGAAYFIKYAFDNNWVSPAARIIIGIICGLAFIGWGEYLQKTQYVSAAQAITGGGIAIIYFSVFGGYYFFRDENILSQPLAMFLTIITTAVSASLSIRYNSKPIALMGLIGGFMAPFILSGDAANYGGLFSYLFILNIGILAIAYERKWDFLGYISFGLTQYIMLTNFSTYFRNIENMFFVTEIFFTMNFILYLAIPIAYSTIRKTLVQKGNSVIIVLNTVIYAYINYISINKVIPEFRGIFMLMMAVVLAVLGTIIKQINDKDKKLISLFYDTSVAFLTIAVPLQLYKYEGMNFITLVWAVEAVALLSIGLKYNDRRMRAIATCILVLAVGKHVFFDIWSSTMLIRDGNYAAVINRWFFETLIVSIAIFTAGYQYASNYHKIGEGEKIFKDIFFMAAVILMCIGISLETDRYFELTDKGTAHYMAKQLALSVIWAVYSIITIVIGIIKRYKPIRMFSIALFAVSIIKVFMNDLPTLTGGYRILSLIVLGIILLIVSFLYQRYKYIIVDDLPLEDEDKVADGASES